MAGTRSPSAQHREPRHLTRLRDRPHDPCRRDLTGLFVTHDGGLHWDSAAIDVLGQEASVQAVVVSPTFVHDGTVFVSVRGRGLFRSTDRGRSFAPVGQGLLDHNQIFDNFSKPTSVPIAFSPAFASDRTLFGYSGTEVFRSSDAGETWTSVHVPRTVHEQATGRRGLLRKSLAIAAAALAAACASYAALSLVRLGRPSRLFTAVRGDFVRPRCSSSLSQPWHADVACREPRPHVCVSSSGEHRRR